MLLTLEEVRALLLALEAADGICALVVDRVAQTEALLLLLELEAPDGMAALERVKTGVGVRDTAEDTDAAGVALAVALNVRGFDAVALNVPGFDGGTVGATLIDRVPEAHLVVVAVDATVAVRE